MLKAAVRRCIVKILCTSAVVELIALPGAKIRYTTIQNWSHNVYNLVTKRASLMKMLLLNG